MKLAKIGIAAAVIALICIPAWANDPCQPPFVNIIYCHTFDQTGNAYSSQNDIASFGLYAQVYDNFTLSPANDHFISIHWTGEYFNPPNQGPIQAWTVNIYTDAGGQPGGLFSTTNVGGTANETFIGNFGGFPTYDYSIAGSWTVTPGVQYWLSVYPDLAFPPQWGWSSAGNQFGPCDGCDLLSYQDFFGARSPLTADMAFSFDVPTPDTGTLMMMAWGALGAAGVIRRKFF